ncbi:MAG: hypothetical protein MJ162_00140 [Treponema sp.]|nr:hypothetical protein [Treponema sp.]
MKTKASFICKSFLFSLLFLMLSCSSLSAKKKKNSEVTVAPEAPAVTVEQESSSESVKLPSASRKRTYFYKIDQSVVDGVEKGAPESIREAMAKLHKNESEYAENEKVLIRVAAEIFNYAYPSEKITWDVYDVPDDNPYIGAINSVNNGIFDTSTGNVDLLSTLLPATLVFKLSAGDENLQQCENSIKGALMTNPDSVIANFVAGVYFLKTGNTETAENFLQKAFDSAHGNMEIALMLSQVLTKNGKPESAAVVLGEVTNSEQNNIEILKQKAYIAFTKQDYNEAEDYVARVLQQTPNNLEFVLFRARIFVEKKDFIHAVSLLDMYSRQDDSSIDYLILRARVQLDWSKNVTAATETVEKALQFYPDNQDALMLAARISSMTDSPVAGKYADELAAVVLASNSDNLEAQIFALDGLIQRENWEEAYVISKKLIETENASSSVIRNHVKVCLKTGRKTEALNKAKEIYEKNPEDEIIAQTYIMANAEVLSRDEALALINFMMNTTSAKIKSYLYYQRSFMQASEDKVLADLRSSLISNPRNEESLFRLYEIYFAKSEYRKAQYYLRQVVSINPNDTSVRKLNEALTQLIK